MTRKPFRTALSSALGSLLLAAACPGALAQAINVSALVTGSAEREPTTGLTAITPCGTACKYVSSANIGMSNAYDVTPGPYTVAAWPPVWLTASLQPSPGNVSESLAIPAPPAGQSYQALNTGLWQRARVIFDAGAWVGTEHNLAVQSFRTGSGAAVVAYSIRLTTEAMDRPHYLDFGLPQRTSAMQAPYYTTNNNNFFDGVDRMQARAAVDVYVDGLPVWTASAHTLKPKRWSDGVFGRVTLAWGASLAGERVTLFLGMLGKGVRTITVLVRSDLRVEDDECRNGGQYNGDVKRCHAYLEGFTLPTVAANVGYVSTRRPDIRVYTR